MVGHDLPERKAEVKRPVGKVALRVRNLRTGERVRDVSFAVRSGEILGIAGLIGSGRTETMMAIFGETELTGGRVLLRGQKVEIRSPIQAVKKGIGLVPENRITQGVILIASIRNNITLPFVSKLARRRAGLFRPRHTIIFRRPR